MPLTNPQGPANPTEPVRLNFLEYRKHTQLRLPFLLSYKHIHQVILHSVFSISSSFVLIIAPVLVTVLAIGSCYEQGVEEV